jgi:hypothetical protein
MQLNLPMFKYDKRNVYDTKLLRMEPYRRGIASVVSRLL